MPLCNLLVGHVLDHDRFSHLLAPNSLLIRHVDDFVFASARHDADALVDMFMRLTGHVQHCSFKFKLPNRQVSTFLIVYSDTVDEIKYRVLCSLENLKFGGRMTGKEKVRQMTRYLIARSQLELYTENECLQYSQIGTVDWCGVHLSAAGAEPDRKRMRLTVAVNTSNPSATVHSLFNVFRSRLVHIRRNAYPKVSD